ncbi:hypothetical protein MP638_005886, partial [Amoeboaphelidium occidentale]
MLNEDLHSQLKKFPYAAEPLSEYLGEYLPDNRFDEEFYKHINPLNAMILKLLKITF